MMKPGIAEHRSRLRFATCLFAFGLVMNASCWCVAEQVNLTAQEVGREMNQAERRLVDLELRYTVDFPHDDGNARLIQTAHYMRKLTAGEPLERHEWRYAIQRGDEENPTVVTSRIDSFDGSRTMRFNQLKDGHERMLNLIAEGRVDEALRLNQPEDEQTRMLGLIAEGKLDDSFPEQSMHELVWYFGLSYGDLILHEQSEFAVTGTSSIGDIDVVVLEGTVYDGAGHMKLWVAPGHGYLPMRVQRCRPGEREPHTAAVMTDIKQVAPGIWYPHTFQWGKPGGHPKTDRKQLGFIRVDMVSVHPLDENQFKIDFPRGTVVNDRIQRTSYRVTE